MTLSFVYWFLLLLSLLTTWWWGSSYDPVNRSRFGGWGLIMFLLLLVIGLRIFGWPIRGG